MHRENYLATGLVLRLSLLIRLLIIIFILLLIIILRILIILMLLVFIIFLLFFTPGYCFLISGEDETCQLFRLNGRVIVLCGRGSVFGFCK